MTTLQRSPRRGAFQRCRRDTRLSLGHKCKTNSCTGTGRKASASARPVLQGPGPQRGQSFLAVALFLPGTDASVKARPAHGPDQGVLSSSVGLSFWLGVCMLQMKEEPLRSQISFCFPYSGLTSRSKERVLGARKP